MHPDIVAFWEGRGYQVEGSSSGGTTVYCAKKSDQGDKMIALKYSDLIKPTHVYFLESKWYSEDDMLRVIKLEAFL